MHKKNDSFISFIMNEKETIVYFYYGKQNKKQKSKKHGFLIEYRNKRKMGKICRKGPAKIRQGTLFQSCTLLFEYPYEMSLLNKEQHAAIVSAFLIHFFECPMEKLLGQQIYINFDAYFCQKLGDIGDGLPCSLFQAYFKAFAKNGVLMVRDGKQAKECLMCLYGQLNHLLLITDQMEKWESFAQMVYEETGLVVEMIPEQLYPDDSVEYHFRNLWEGQLLFDFNKVLPPEIRRLPRKITYVDFAGSFDKNRWLKAKRKDVEYISFFDEMKLQSNALTLAKDVRYNTLVK